MNTTYIYKKANSILGFAFIIISMVSCQDYLEEQPSTLIDSNYVYTTEEGLKSGVVSYINLIEIGMTKEQKITWELFFYPLEAI